MKIDYLSNMRFPSERAYSRQVVEMCRAFSLFGNEVTLYVNSRNTKIVEDAESYYGFAFPFKVKRIKTPDIMEYGKIGFVITTFIFAVNVAWNQRTREVDLIYCRSEWTLSFLEFLYPARKKIYESHEAKNSFPVRFLFRRGVKCVVISEGIREFYLKQGVPKENILVAHDGVDSSFFDSVESKMDSRCRLDLPLDKKIAMYIGGFDRWKGVQTFFEAASYSNDIKLVAIGGKDEEVKYYQNRYPRVMFLGQRPYKELKNNQQAADVLVIPNTSKNELAARYTSPLKLFAHLAARVPLVVTDVPSLRQVVTDREVYFTKSDDPQALAKTISFVCQNKKESQEKSANAYKLAKQYTWEKRAQDIVDFISGDMV